MGKICMGLFEIMGKMGYFYNIKSMDNKCDNMERAIFVDDLRKWLGYLVNMLFKKLFDVCSG